MTSQRVQRLGQGLDVREIVVHIPAGVKNVSPVKRPEGTGVHPAYCSMGTGERALLPGAKLPDRETDHSPHVVPKLRTSGTVPTLSHTPSWRAHFTLTFISF
jgi:hypothetical protein